MAKRDSKSKKKAADGAAAMPRRPRRREAGPTPDAPNVPGWLPFALFGALTVILFREFVFSDLMLFGSDTNGLGYVARAFYADALTRLGDFPGWAPQILGGTPFLEALSAGDSLYPPSALLLLLMDPHRALGWKLVLHVLAAGFFMFGWVRAIGASRAAALVGGTAYMLAPYFVTLVFPGHDGKMFVTALAPLLFWAVESHFARPRIRSFASIALVVGLVILTTHFQMAYFLFLGVGFFAFHRAIEMARGSGGDAGAGEDASRDGGDGKPSRGGGSGESGDSHASVDAPTAAPDRRRAKPAAIRFAVFLAASLVGAGIAGVQLFPAFGYVTQDSRRVATTREEAGETSKDWAASWSLHPEEMVSLVVPEFVGASVPGAAWTQGTYWGRNVFKLNHEYLGLVALLLAAVSFVGGTRRGLRWFMAGLGVVAALLALGAYTPIWHIAYASVKGVSYFRAMSQVIFLTGFAVATLAALGFDRILLAAREDDEEAWATIQKVLLGGVGAIGLFLVLAASGVLTSMWTSVLYSDILPQRAQALEALGPFIVRGAGISLVIAGAVTALVWATRRHYLAPTGLLAGIVLLVVVDEIRIDLPFIQTQDFAVWSQPDANIQAILDREASSEEPYRLLSFVQGGQDVDPAMYGIELAAGHHPNDLNRYRQLIGMVGGGAPEYLGYAPIRRLLNVKYILWPDATQGPAPQVGPVLSQLQYSDGTIHSTLMAEDGLPRARLAGEVVIRSEEEDVPYMLSGAFDPATQVVLAEAPPIALDGSQPVGSVRWVERGPDAMTLSVTSDRPTLLVVADNWYPGWKATVDGVEAPVLRAYHTLRAVPIEAGEHTVEMYYQSDVVRRSLWLSILLFVAVVGAAGVEFWRERRRESTP